MTKRYLTYFMWGYQEHFQLSMERRAISVLVELGIDLPLQGLLIGVRSPEVAEGYKVCLVPEDGDLDPATFSSCHSRTEEIFANHPDHANFYGDAPSMRDKPENIRRKSVREAVAETLTHFGNEQGAVQFCGIPVLVHNYYVVPAFLVSQEHLNSVPHLVRPITFQDWTSRTSIVDALLFQLLAEASEGLGGKEPGRFHEEFSADIQGILRQAAADFCYAISLAIQDFMLQEVFHSLNKISALRYEGAATNGSIVFSPPDAIGIDYQVLFHKSTPLTSTQFVRKLVEMSGDDLACVCSSSKGLNGLASITTADAPLFRAIFTGHYRWSLLYGDTILMDCAFGVPVLPSPCLTELAFLSNIRRILPGLTSTHEHTLWEAVSAAIVQRHGTMLVVSGDAMGEADRLQNQSITIQPKTLCPDLVEKICGIDGAVLLDKECQCHAIGVILDGMASQAGDSSRGSRFNSAVRYVSSVKVPTLCLVISEDGYVDMVPTLRPQIEKSEVEYYVKRLRSLTSENYHSTRNWLDDHRFYLTPEQCEVVNAELGRIHSEPQEVGRIRIVTQPFVPHPEMDEGYYLDSDAGGS